VCEACHTNGLGRPLATDCSSCHESDRPSVDHYAGLDCATCHTPEGWEQVVVNHEFFPLVDAHDLACKACHVGGTYGGLSPACASCHEDDRPPDHFLGVDCGSCHRPTTWGDASYDHTFPVPHHEADACTDCHVNAPDYSVVSCFDACHEHNRSETDDEHDEVRNYVYESSACIACHPTGRADD
jgi:hypothetical protein